MEPKQIKALVSLLDDEDHEVVRHVEQQINSLGHKIIPFLEEEWDKNNAAVRKKLEGLIHGMHFELVKNRLQEWLKKPLEERNLLEGMWIVASYEYPGLQYRELKQQIEQLYYEAWLEFKYDMHPFDQVKVLNNILFSKIGFKANTKDFHASGNSMINQVLKTKKGNPISLCVVYMLVANKLKLPVHGVNLPNLFILTYKNEDTQFYINAFNKGLIFSRADIDNYIAQLHLPPKDIYYEPCSYLDIVQRVVRNLIISYDKAEKNLQAEDMKLLLKILEG